MKNLFAFAVALFLLSAGSAFAQTASVAAACSAQTLPVGYANGTLIVKTNGDLCSSTTISPAAATTGGADNYTFEVAASDNHQVVKNGAGTVYDLDAFSVHTAAMFVRLYNLGTGFNGCNSATGLIWEGNLPGAATGAGFVHATFGPTGRAFTTGLAICVTGAFGNTNTTAATASVASVNIGYK